LLVQIFFQHYLLPVKANVSATKQGVFKIFAGVVVNLMRKKNSTSKVEKQL